MLSSTPPLTPYHRLARTAVHRWWRAPLGTAFVIVGGLVLIVLLLLGTEVIAAIGGFPHDQDGLPMLGALPDLAVSFLCIAVMLPVPMLAARWVQRRPAGTLSSTAGRLRLAWLATCMPVAFVAIVLVLAGGLALPAETTGDSDGPLVGWGPFAASVVVLLLVVPLQAAAEEYLFRGWLLQAVGTACRGPWVPVVAQAGVFAAMHGWGTPWGFADLVVVGVVAGWLTIRTGGLEAAIALHVMNNLLDTMLCAAYGDFSLDQTAADMPWAVAAIDVPLIIGYAATIAWLATRRGINAGTARESEPPTPAQLIDAGGVVH